MKKENFQSLSSVYEKVLSAQVLSGTDFIATVLPQVVGAVAIRASFWQEHKLKFLPIVIR